VNARVCQIEEKDVQIRELETRLESMKPLHELQQSVDSQNWDELSRVVDGLKTLSAARRSYSSTASYRHSPSPPPASRHAHWHLPRQPCPSLCTLVNNGRGFLGFRLKSKFEKSTDVVDDVIFSARRRLFFHLSLVRQNAPSDGSMLSKIFW